MAHGPLLCRTLTTHRCTALGWGAKQVPRLSGIPCLPDIHVFHDEDAREETMINTMMEGGMMGAGMCPLCQGPWAWIAGILGLAMGIALLAFFIILTMWVYRKYLREGKR